MEKIKSHNLYLYLYLYLYRVITIVDITVSVSLVLSVVFFTKTYTIKVDCVSAMTSFNNIVVTTSPVESLSNVGSFHATLVYYTFVITLDADAACDILCWYKCVALFESLTGPFVYVIFNDRCHRIFTNVCIPLSFHCIYTGYRHCGCCRDVRCYRRDARPSKIQASDYLNLFAH